MRAHFYTGFTFVSTPVLVRPCVSDTVSENAPGVRHAGFTKETALIPLYRGDVLEAHHRVHCAYYVMCHLTLWYWRDHDLVKC